ncbi:DUF523 domain-containing protein [Scandinavium goeteborgense]|uniref:DUF523 domain-containing protein n=1 Tax=Scandinavium goeteborgense TaxID=1851514 RepID=UPI000D7C0659|nr:DUF523 domain-containing protein [Scandinavium goeteborgense]MCS2153876.1 DUF523 domain-containing protein [Scandinavium goeteborgense]
MKTKILVSACLMGHPVRYNASAKTQLGELLHTLRAENRLVIHCPELAAGLPTPRPSAEIVAGQGEQVMAGEARIIESTGADVTAHYQLAAWLALEAAQREGCSAALLTDGSPTCGSTEIYDGSFSGKKIAGNGVAAALLRQHGITVFSHEQIPALLAWIKQQDEKA